MAVDKSRLGRESHPILVKFFNFAICIKPLPGPQQYAHHLTALLNSCGHHLFVCAILKAIHNDNFLPRFPNATEAMHAADTLFHCRWIPSEIKQYDVPAIVVQVDSLLGLW